MFDEYPVTRSSLIRLVQEGSDEERQKAARELAVIYSPVLVRCLQRQQRMNEEQAQDHVQDFLINKLLDERFKNNGDRVKLAPESFKQGKFRHFLWGCFKRFLIQQIRKNKNQETSADPNIFQDTLESDELLKDFEREFYEEYARQVMSHSLKDFKQHCEQRNQLDLWKMFCMRVIRPIAWLGDEVDYKTVVTELNLKSTKQARNILASSKLVFKKCLDDTIANTELSTDEQSIEAIRLELSKALANGAISEAEGVLPQDPLLDPDYFDNANPNNTASPNVSLVLREIIEFCHDV